MKQSNVAVFFFLASIATFSSCEKEDGANSKKAVTTERSFIEASFITTNVSTFAGTGVAGLKNGLLTEANFSYPLSAIADANGNFYVADLANYCVRRISAEGIVTTYAGSGIRGYKNGPAYSAEFEGVSDMVIGKDGSLYIADSQNYAIRKITPAGVVSTFAGCDKATQGFKEGQGVKARFGAPNGIVIDKAGNFFVSDPVDHCIWKITPSGYVTTYAGTNAIGYRDGERTQARFNTPRGIAIDNFDNLYITDGENEAVRKITSDGIVSTIARKRPDGEPLEIIDRVYGIEVDKRGNVFFTEASANPVIRMIGVDGVVSTVAGGNPFGFADGSGEEAQFWAPFGLNFDKDGNLYVADAGNNRIRKIVFQE